MVAISWSLSTMEQRTNIVRMLIQNGIFAKAVVPDSMDYDLASGVLSFNILKVSDSVRISSYDFDLGHVTFALDENNQWVTRSVEMKLAWSPREFDILVREITEHEMSGTGYSGALKEGAL